ncbi:MAG TPA: hypothetical protein VGI66_19045 [Streptosporangiaceae bacterium]|jgi:hypothetical protein
MNHTSDTAAADNGGNFDPQQAADLLDQATRQARRTFAPGRPLLWVFRAVLVLVAFGSFWLSVRGRNPYSAPSGGVLAVIFVLVAINIGWSVSALKRAGAGVSGPAQRKRRAWIGVMLVVWAAAFAFTAPLYHAGASHPIWGLYPANEPLMIVGLFAAATAAVRRDWPMAGTTLAIAIVAAVAGFGGPAGAWLIMGIGLCAVCLGTAAFTVWQQRRSVVRP